MGSMRKSPYLPCSGCRSISAVIIARHWGNLSFEQIAAAAGCSASTAHRRYTAGVEHLRQELGVTWISNHNRESSPNS